MITHNRRSVLRQGAATAGLVAVDVTALTSCAALRSPAPVAGPAASGIRLVDLDKLTVGQAAVLTAPAGEPVVLLRTGAGVVAAHSGICTHQGCTVTSSDATVRCPCHGSIFNAATGEVVTGPAQMPLPAVAVRIVQGQVVTA